MKIIYLNDSQQSIGGGWTFKRNLEKIMTKMGHQTVEDLKQADIAFVAGPTMVTRETIDSVKASQAKLVVRLDNVPRNSRNRNTGTSRLKEFAQKADQVVWQCVWAQDYLEDFVQSRGVIIRNGVDMEIFNKTGKKIDFGTKENVFLYSRFNRDETKNWEVAWYKFQMLYRENRERKLILVGQFSPEQVEYNFDFFRGEDVTYFGVVDDPNRMAEIMRGCGHFLATYYNDCYSNTYQEAIACGCELFEPDMSGGTPEMVCVPPKSLEEMGEEYEKLFLSLLK